MVLHGVADDVGDLGVASVVLFPKGVHYAALDRLEAVLDSGDGAAADYVSGILPEVEVEEVAHRARAGEVARRGWHGRRRGGRNCVRFGGRAARSANGRRLRAARSVRHARRARKQVQIVEKARRLRLGTALPRVLAVFLPCHWRRIIPNIRRPRLGAAGGSSRHSAASAFSASASTSASGAVGSNRRTMRPSRPIRNFVKFHLIDGLDA